MRYMMSGPWNETSSEYYEEIQKLAHHFTNVKNSNRSSLNKDVKAMELAYCPGNEKERVATELERHGGTRYMMSDPWNETSCEYYEEIQQLAWLTAPPGRSLEASPRTPSSPPPRTPATTRKQWDAPAH